MYPQRQQATFADFHSVHWCNSCYKCHSKLFQQYQCNWCHKMLLMLIEYPMSNVNKVKLLSERTSGVPPVIFLLDSLGSFGFLQPSPTGWVGLASLAFFLSDSRGCFGFLQHSASGRYVLGSLAFIHLSPTHTWVTSSTIFSPFNLFWKDPFHRTKRFNLTYYNVNTSWILYT